MADIVIVGESWGEEEEEAQAPFIGPSGRLLKGLLSSVGIAFGECFVTNVFNLRPKPSNDITDLPSRSDAIPSAFQHHHPQIHHHSGFR